MRTAARGMGGGAADQKAVGVPPSTIGPPRPQDVTSFLNLTEIAERIRTRLARSTADIIDIGRDLIEVKNKLDHGEFADWISREFSMSTRTPQLYTRAAMWAEGKNEIVAFLQPTALYLLSAKSTPPEIADQAVADLEAGKKLNVSVVKARVEAARQDRILEKKKREQNLTRTKAYRQRRKREHDAWLAKVAAERAESEQKADQIARLLCGKLSPEEACTLSRLLGENYSLQRLRERLLKPRPTGNSV